VLTKSSEGGTYQGTMRVKFGPTVAVFRGEAKLAYDHSVRRCTIQGRGIDGRGHFVARISSRAKSARRIHFHVRRTYSGRPSSSMRFSEATAMATSVVCRPSVRERSASPITRL